MEITSHEINSDTISLTTDTNVVGLTVSFGDQKFTTGVRIWDINNTTISITKEALGLAILDNKYFKLELTGDTGEIEASMGIYHINIENERETPLYNAAILKQELDNLNYYSGTLQSLTEKKAFQEANDFFFNYKTFLEKKLNGNNIIQIISG